MFKKLLLVFATTMYLTGCSELNTIRMMFANDDIAPTWPTNKTEQVFSAVYIGEKPYINVTLNGEELLFLIDTGASFTMLFDTEKGKQLATDKGYDLAVIGWGEGEKTPAYQTTINDFKLGNVLFKQVKLAYIPISTSSYYLIEEEAIFDGVLGHDLLRHFAWTFDKRNNKITASASPMNFSQTDNVIPVEITFKKPSIPTKVTFNDQHHYERDIIIDTGSRHYLKLNTQFMKSEKIAIPASITAADFGMSGMVEHQRINTESLQIGDVQLYNVKTNIIPSDDEDDWWVIGSALMNQFVTVLDYHTSNFALIPYEKSTFKSRYNLAGLELRKLQNGHFIVRYIFPNVDRDNLNLSVGDEITSINNIDASQISESDWLSLASQEGDMTLCTAGKPCESIALAHIEGYSK